MADNEGRLDSVQAWDDQIVTVGAMQKTINSAGRGELPEQVYRFSQTDPAHYKMLFSDRGWSVERTGKGTGTNDYTMSFTVDGRTMTGKELNSYIKTQNKPAHWTNALDPLLDAGRDPAFQALQITDLSARLNKAVNTVPASAGKVEKYRNPISAYVTSEQGVALVLDQSINRPAHVSGTFGRALDAFFAANPKASRDPASWTSEQRNGYETQILSAYANARTRTTMTDAGHRAEHIIGAKTTLSAEPGSFVSVGR